MMFWFMWTIVFAVLLSMIAVAICLIVIEMTKSKIIKIEEGECGDEGFIFERGHRTS